MQADDWTLDDLYCTNHDDNRIADLSTTLRLVDEYHTMWMDAPPSSASTLLPWLCEHFHIDVDLFDWDVFELKLEQEHHRIGKLLLFLHYHHVDDPAVRRNLMNCARVLYNARYLFIHLARFLMTVSPESIERRRSLPEQLRDDDVFRAQTEHVRDHDDEKMTPFQRVFLYLASVLEGKEYRRADGKFFERVVLRDSNLPTLAFKEALSVSDFVARNTTHSYNFKEWKWVTEPPKNFEHIVDYMSTRPLSEAPDLVENCHLRSYAGDEVGRGAGVYDCNSDFFFPYAVRDSWDEMAEYVSRVRAEHDPEYTCVAPSSAAVCVTHFDAPFPYDIFSEVVIMPPLGLCWRNADEFECPECEQAIDSCELGDLLCTLLSEVDFVSACVGASWQVTHVEPPSDWVELHDDDLRGKLRGAIVQLDEDGVDVPVHSYVRVDDLVYVPLCTPARRRRAHVTSSELGRVRGIHGRTNVRSSLGVEWVREYDVEWEGDEVVDAELSRVLDGGCAWTPRGVVDSTAFVRSHAYAGVRYRPVRHTSRFFRVHTGRTWRECDAAEIDQIYDTQRFTVADKYMLYALKGRMFFEVGEKDKHQITLFLEGVGGSGKSTILKVQQQYWPPHLRGILSSNIQPQFGMSAVAKAKAVFCNEVSAELSVNQEEWMGAVSGEWGSYAVKFKEPLVLKWSAQFFWVGNSFPTKFNNRQGQVSRRLGGVLMSHPVPVRDGNIMHKMMQKLGSLQRKEVLAYFEFVRLTGSIDPMGQPEMLPPAFAEYNRRSRRATDPILDFLSEGTFVKYEPGSKMLMSEFKELYNAYRLKYDMGKPLKWGEEVYRTPFNERGLVVKREVRVMLDGVEHRNVDIIFNLSVVSG